VQVYTHPTDPTFKGYKPGSPFYGSEVGNRLPESDYASYDLVEAGRSMIGAALQGKTWQFSCPVLSKIDIRLRQRSWDVCQEADIQMHAKILYAAIVILSPLEAPDCIVYHRLIESLTCLYDLDAISSSCFPHLQILI